MSSIGDTPGNTGPTTTNPSRLGRLERAVRATDIVNGGDIEVFPSETGVGRILRLSAWIRARLGLEAGGGTNAAEEATAAAVEGSAVLLKITGLHSDSPASGVRMYLGDLYANGSAAAATTTGVTVRIPGIAADVALPSYGAWSDTGFCGAIQTTQTWTGASTTHTDDTVYEATGDVLLR